MNMTASIPTGEKAYENIVPATEKDLFSILGEPGDPNSDWSEIRFAQLAGHDYMFISTRVNRKLANKSTMSDFILDAYQIMGTTHEKAKIYIYVDHPFQKPEFAFFDINWFHGEVKEFHIRPVKNLDQKEFIRTVFEHSGLLLEAE